MFIPFKISEQLFFMIAIKYFYCKLCISSLFLNEIAFVKKVSSGCLSFRSLKILPTSNFELLEAENKSISLSLKKKKIQIIYMYHNYP